MAHLLKQKFYLSIIYFLVELADLACILAYLWISFFLSRHLVFLPCGVFVLMPEWELLQLQ